MKEPKSSQRGKAAAKMRCDELAYVKNWSWESGEANVSTHKQIQR